METRYTLDILDPLEDPRAESYLAQRTRISIGGTLVLIVIPYIPIVIIYLLQSSRNYI